MSGFIFDMDGCLLNSIGAWHAAERDIMAMTGLTLPKDERDDLNALTLEEAAVWFHERFGVMDSSEEVAHMIVERMLAFYHTTADANPGALAFVRSVCDAGQPMCVLSSSPQAFLQAGLGHAGMLELFDGDLVISAEDKGWAKRDSSTFDHVCKLLGTAPADTWLFDDSWYALKTAHEMGLRTVGVFSSDNCGTHDELARYADKVVDTFEELSLADFDLG